MSTICGYTERTPRVRGGLLILLSSFMLSAMPPAVPEALPGLSGIRVDSSVLSEHGVPTDDSDSGFEGDQTKSDAEISTKKGRRNERPAPLHIQVSGTLSRQSFTKIRTSTYSL